MTGHCWSRQQREADLAALDVADLLAGGLLNTLLGAESVDVVGELAVGLLQGSQLPLFVGVFVIAVTSGVQYVWIWSAKARREREAIRLKPR